MKLTRGGCHNEHMGSDDYTEQGALIRKLRTKNTDLRTLDGFRVALGHMTGEEKSKSTVSLWETGKVRPPDEQLEAIDDLLDADGAILKAYDYQPRSVAPSREEIMDRIAELEASIRSLIVGDGKPDEALTVVLDRMATSMEKQQAALEALVLRDATPARGVPSPGPVEHPKKQAASAKPQPAR